jgi:membrane associated rhomboid family serine protease
MPPPRPWLTYALIAANLICFAISVAAGLSPINPDGRRLLEVGGNLGALTLEGEPWRLVTATFLHAGVAHLAMNMLALFDGGRQIEAIYGRAGLGAIYASAGLVGGLASAMRGAAVSVGASGAIFGLFGAFAGFLLRHRDRLDPLAVRAAGRGLLMLLGFNLVLGVSLPGIDMMAHLGGAIGGALAGWAIERAPRGWSLARRSIVVAAAAVAVVGAAVLVAPTPRADVPVVVAEFFEVDAQAAARLSELLSDERMPIAARVEALEREVGEPYRAARRQLEDGALDERWSRLRRVARAREQALTDVIAGVRANDRDRISAAVDAWGASVDLP